MIGRRTVALNLRPVWGNTSYEFYKVPNDKGNKNIMIEVSGDIVINGEKVKLSQLFDTGVELIEEDVDGTNVIKTNTTK